MVMKDEPQGGNTRGLLYEGTGNTAVSNRTKLTQKNSLRVDTTGSPSSSTQHPHDKVISDARSGNHLMTIKVPTTNIIPVQHGKVAIIPYENKNNATHKGLLKLNGISDNVRIAHIFPGTIAGALVSLGNLYDDRCNMTINIIYLNIYKKGQHLMTGPIHRQTSMWELELNNPNIYPWHPPPIVSENLMINRIQYLRKVVIKKHNNFFPAVHTQKL